MFVGTQTSMQAVGHALSSFAYNLVNSQLFVQTFTVLYGQILSCAKTNVLPLQLIPLVVSMQFTVAAPVSAFPPRLVMSPKNKIMFIPTIRTITKPISIVLLSSSQAITNLLKG